MIIRIVFTVLMSLLGFLLHAQENQIDEQTIEKGVAIELTVPRTSSDEGKVYFALYNSKESFDKREPYKRVTGSIVGKSTKVQFTDIPVGTYAITCFHDANDNKVLDFSGFRPIEDYGSSNNPQILGPPQFDASKFEVKDTNLTFEIRF